MVSEGTGGDEGRGNESVFPIAAQWRRRSVGAFQEIDLVPVGIVGFYGGGPGMAFAITVSADGALNSAPIYDYIVDDDELLRDLFGSSS